MIEPLSIAFQGEPGAYSEAAALEYFGEQAVTRPCHAFEDVFTAVTNDQVTHGILPIENSLAGSIHRNYDLLLRNQLHIVGEYHYRVRHCLLGLRGVRLDEIARVHSHPQALAQCEASLARLKLDPVVEADTAGSARWLKESGARLDGAIASHRAAQVYNLDILVENFEDNPANFTRFLIIARQPLIVVDPDQVQYKTSIVFSMHNLPGILFKAMSVFALRDIDLTKIESRPIAGKPWEYMFYIDFVGHVQTPVCTCALAHLEELTVFLRILGSYPRHQLDY
jgi:arogenate/prephenate dehydratase